MNNQNVENIVEIKNQKNIIVLGRRGEGKTHFLNMLIQSQNPRKGLFKDNQICQFEFCKITFGKNEKLCLSLNLVEVLLDVEDDLQQQLIARIEKFNYVDYFKKLEQILYAHPFQGQINRLILVIKVEKFNIYLKNMFEIIQIIACNPLKICVILNKCNSLYSENFDKEQEILETLNNTKKYWEQIINSFQIEDIILISDQVYGQTRSKYEKVAKFYNQEWEKLYEIITKSSKMKMRVFSELSSKEKAKLKDYFKF